MSDVKYVNTEGVFRCRVLKPKYGWFDESSTGTPSIRLPLEVVENNNQKSYLATCQCYLSEKSFEGTIRKLIKAFPSWDGNLDALEKETFSFEGLEAPFEFYSESYNGKERIKVQLPNVSSGISKERVSSIVNQFSDRSLAIAKQEKMNLESPADDSEPF